MLQRDFQTSFSGDSVELKHTQKSGKMGMKALTRNSLNSTEISVAVLKKGYPQDGSELSLWLFAERNWHRSVCT